LAPVAVDRRRPDELVALVAQFLLTNFMNNVADTDIDFPPAPHIP
jgi:hypothetical protein